MKRNFLLLLFSFTVSYACAQNFQLIDSLKSQLLVTTDKNRFEILNDLAWEYRASYPDSTIYFATQARQLAQRIGLRKGTAKSLNFTGVAHNNKAELVLAFQSYSEALKVSSTDGDSVQLAYAHINIGRLFFEEGLLSKAYDHIIKSLDIFNRVKHDQGLAYTYQSLANLYTTQGDYVKAEQNYIEAFKIRLKQNNTRDIMAALMYIGRFYQTSHQHDKAIQFLLRADSAGRVIHDEINLAEINTNIAKSYLNKNLFDQALARCMDGLTVIRHKKNVLLLPQAYLTLGEIKFRQNKLKEARTSFTEGLQVAIQAKDISSKMDAYYWLWQLAQKEHNQTEELQTYNHYLVLKDSIEDLEVTRQVDRLQFVIEIERKEKENELLKANSTMKESIIERQKLQNIILAILVGFATVLGVLQWQNIKMRRRVNLQLGKRNDELFRLNKEKDTLMSFVAHDLKTPLNHIKGISDLLEMEGALNENQHMYLGIIKNATQAELDLINDLLDVHKLEENNAPQFETINLHEALTNRYESMLAIAVQKNIQLTSTFDSVSTEMVETDESYLNRIIDNLVSNAIKFSNNGSTVQMKAGKTSTHFWLSVRDQGPGFTAHDKRNLFQKFKKLSARPTAGESSNGLGLAIVKTLVDRLQGTVELLSEPDQGSEFIVMLPLTAKK